jgi:hypothetical protein
MRKDSKPVDKVEFCERLDSDGLYGVVVNSMGTALKTILPLRPQFLLHSAATLDL